MSKILSISLVLGLASLGAFATEAEKLFVRSPHAKILESARMDSKAVSDVTRGTELQLVLRQGAWVQVKTANGKSGWMMGAFVQNEPVSASADALAQAEANDPRTIRRRGPRAASMGVRGLSSGAGKLNAKDADAKALEKVEKQEAKPEHLQQYQKDLSRDR